MKEIDIPRIEDFIKTLSREDLIYLNHLIVDRIKILSQVKSSEKMAQFHKGQRVCFIDHDGREQRGKVIKLNKKTVSIITDYDHQWNVAPELLKSLD